MDYNSDTSAKSSQKLTVETKGIFDTILKVAMKKADESKNNNVDAINIDPSEEVGKSYIIDKFFDGSNVKTEADTHRSLDVVKPIPKPRKSKAHLTTKVVDNSSTNSLLSQGTYVIEVDSKNKEQSNVIAESKVSVFSSNHSKLHYKAEIESVSTTETSEGINTYRVENSKVGDNSGGVTENIGNDIESKSKADLHEIKNEDNKQDKYNYNNILEIIVHKTDYLELNSYITYPAVKIHIVDVSTGKYYLKSDRKRPVVFYYENDEQDYILPIMTSSYNLQKKRTFNPVWEDSVIFNEEFNYLTNENVIIFFEVLDNIPVLARCSDKLQKDYVKGWHRIAFAFLKVIGKGGCLNFNKKLKLQLYCFKNIKKQEAFKCDLWELWKANKLKKYPSALFVTVKEIVSPKKVVQSFRSRTPLQRENIVCEVRSSRKHNSIVGDNVGASISSRHSKDFQVPNKYLAKIDTNENGCFLLKFSNNGLYLACVVQIEETFAVVVYLVESWEEINSFNDHCGFIYRLKWSLDDSLLLTASADNTVAVWHFQSHNFEQILPHPMFVYACHISSDNSLIVTGCFDAIVRIWLFNTQDKRYRLYQEMEKHDGYVTSVCINKKTTNVYSSDSVGRIIDWKKIGKSEWAYERDMILPDLRNTVINETLLFPNEKKMLVHSRDSILRIISVKRICVLFWLHGAFNSRIQTFCSISRCGNYVSSGSENGLVVVWNAKTGEACTSYDPFPNSARPQPVHCVDFHPKDNIIALSHYGSNLSISLYHSNQKVEEVMEKQEETIKNNTYKSQNINNVETVINKSEKIDFNHILHKIDMILK